MIAVAIFLVAALTTSQSAADAHDGPARARARDRGRLHDRDVDSRGRRALPPRERNADRRRGGRHDGDDQLSASASSTIRSSCPCRSAGSSRRSPAWPSCGCSSAATRPRRPSPPRPVRDVTVRAAAFLGVGAMVGAGIFALLGEAGAVAGSAVWLSFLLAGAVSMLIGYNVVKLGVRYPSSGGLFAYLLRGSGTGAWSGSPRGSATSPRCSSSARCRGLVRRATPSRSSSATTTGAAGTTSSPPRSSSRWPRSTSSGRPRREAQSLIVFVLLAVFAVFIAVTIFEIDFDLLAFSDYPPVSDIVASVALTFFAYLGFSVITFAVGDMRDPSHDLPKAMNRALGVTTLLYVLVCDRRLRDAHRRPGHRVRRDRDRRGGTARARRRGVHDDGDRRAGRDGRLGRSRPSTPRSGLTSDAEPASAQFPPFFGRGSRLGPKSGDAHQRRARARRREPVDLSAIASVGSACSLAIFLLVGVAGYRLRRETGRTGVARPRRRRRDRGRARVLRRRHAAQCARRPSSRSSWSPRSPSSLDFVWKRVRGEPPAGAAAPVTAQE